MPVGAPLGRAWITSEPTWTEQTIDTSVKWSVVIYFL
ncbi:hypothetical protein MYIN104542_13940 [Mycobacterium intermedium]